MPDAAPAESRAEWQADLADDRAGIDAAERGLVEALARRHMGPAEARGTARGLLARAGSLGALLASPAAAEAGLAGDLALADALLDTVLRRQIEGIPLDAALIGFYARARLWPLRRRELHIFLLDGDRRLLADSRLAEGAADHVPLYPREVAARALAADAASVWLASNMPCRAEVPDPALRLATRAAARALGALGIGFGGHIVIARDRVLTLSGAD